MIKDPTIPEVLTEQALRLRRRVQNQFATLPLPLATYIPPVFRRLRGVWLSWAIYCTLIFVVFFAVTVVFTFLAMFPFTFHSSPPIRHSMVVEPQWVSTTTAAPATPAPVQRLSVDTVEELPPTHNDGKGRDECQRYLANYTDRADHHCGVVDVEERIVCLSEREALLHYDGQQFWRIPVMYHVGDKRVLVSALLAQCPERVQTMAYLPYSVIFFDANDQKRRVTIQEDTCLQILHNALSGAPLCTSTT